MSKPKVFATHSLFDAARKILNESCDVEYWAKSERPPREEGERGIVEGGAETAHRRERGGGV